MLPEPPRLEVDLAGILDDFRRACAIFLRKLADQLEPPLRNTQIEAEIRAEIEAFAREAAISRECAERRAAADMAVAQREARRTPQRPAPPPAPLPPVWTTSLRAYGRR